MWFLSARKSRPTPVARSARSPYRPRLEALEDRCLLSAGALDPTFGNGAGYVTTPLVGVPSRAQNVLIQPNGEIVAFGRQNSTEFVVERYNLNGSLDTSFGSGGITQVNFAPDSLSEAGSSGIFSALYPVAGMPTDGDIVQQGYVSTSQGWSQVLVRYTTSGTLDPTFGNGGVLMTGPLPGLSSGSSVPEEGGVVVTSTGKIVTFTDGGGNQFVLACYNTDGSLDTSFGAGGYVPIPLRPAYVDAKTRTRNGRIRLT